ncbi:diguanylate cyclase [Lelliottia sp. WAP21]|uniref:diguanylate cyclase n=1 Tax=Lelliottia sp. WAP21 TaxID=2877426 RepID=UPI001E2BD7AB|nr:diguanylate cyclase [Lelliottia sp. WAP21]
MRRRFSEIDATLRVLNDSTDTHFKGLVTIMRLMANRLDDVPEITSNNTYSQCELGHWLNEQLKEGNEDKPFLLDLSVKHNRVHVACRQLLTAIKKGCFCPQAYDNFENALLEFKESLLQYRRYLLQLSTSYDSLTGLPLRRVLDESFEKMNSGEVEDGLYLLLLDIDHFKKVNDTYGHLIGDAVLRSLALNLEENIRRAETVYRYGGEEFIILLQANNDREAVAAAERLRERVAATETVSGEKRIRITFTSGLTRVQSGETLREVVERADKALYQGKHSGRNCTMLIDQHLDCLNVSR